MTPADPATQGQILAALEGAEHDLATFLEALPTAVFFGGTDERWSPAHHALHLAQANRPLTRALGLPKLVIAAVGGRTRRRSCDFAGVRAAYLKVLADGGRASGRFLPTLPADHRSETQASIVADFRKSVQELREAVALWSGRDLDRFVLPHPLLGKLTVTEMLYFAVYHHQHHLHGLSIRTDSVRTDSTDPNSASLESA